MKRKKTKGRIREFERSTEKKTVEDYRREREEIAQRPKKKKKVKINKSKIIMTAIVVLLIAVLGMSMRNVFLLRNEQKELNEKQQELLSEKNTLKNELDNINDLEYIEEQARIQLRMIKPGEILFITEDNKTDEDEHDEKDD